MKTVFDRKQIRRQRSRSSASPPENFFLFDWAIQQIEESLSIVRRKFPTCVQIGARGRTINAASFGIDTLITTDLSLASLPHINAIQCEDDFLPFAKNSIDLVVSPLALHTVNDLPGCLLQIRQILKPDGLFSACMLGGETLFELRDCLAQAELEMTDGVTPRIAPFADKQQLGGLLQRAGLALPVVDSEIITVTYQSIFHLMRDLRLMGEGNAIGDRKKHFTSKKLFLRAGEIYAQKYAENDGRIKASFEIIFLHGWAPSKNQQQPLRPGSAKNRLADYLETTEISTGEKPH